jgi:hypothetical protein
LVRRSDYNRYQSIDKIFQKKIAEQSLSKTRESCYSTDELTRKTSEIKNTKRKNSEGDINTASIRPAHVSIRYMDVVTAADYSRSVVREVVKAVLTTFSFSPLKIFDSGLFSFSRIHGTLT